METLVNNAIATMQILKLFVAAKICDQYNIHVQPHEILEILSNETLSNLDKNKIFVKFIKYETKYSENDNAYNHITEDSVEIEINNLIPL